MAPEVCSRGHVICSYHCLQKNMLSLQRSRIIRDITRGGSEVRLEVQERNGTFSSTLNVHCLYSCVTATSYTYSVWVPVV